MQLVLRENLRQYPEHRPHWVWWYMSLAPAPERPRPEIRSRRLARTFSPHPEQLLLDRQGGMEAVTCQPSSSSLAFFPIGFYLCETPFPKAKRTHRQMGIHSFQSFRSGALDFWKGGDSAESRVLCCLVSPLLMSYSTVALVLDICGLTHMTHC